MTTIPAGVLAAAVLAAEKVSFVLVGSAALWLRCEIGTVKDADIVIEPVDANFTRLRQALTGMGAKALPSAGNLPDKALVSVDTAYGRVIVRPRPGRRSAAPGIPTSRQPQAPRSAPAAYVVWGPRITAGGYPWAPYHAGAIAWRRARRGLI